MMASVIGDLSLSLLCSGLSDKIKEAIQMRAFKELYYSDFDVVFKKSLKETCKLFLDDKHSPYKINSEILDSLVKADDIYLSMIFVDNSNISTAQYSEKDCFDRIKQALKNYVSINFDEEIEDVFYDIWIDKFSEIYKKNFKEKGLTDDTYYREIMLNSQSKLLESWSSIETIKSDIKEVKNTLADTQTNSNYPIKTNIINDVSGFSSFSQEVKNKIKDYVNKGDYRTCIGYIIGQIENQNKLNSELLSQKGFCEFNLHDYVSSANSYEEAYNLNKSDDKNVSNIIKCYINSGHFDKIKNYIDKYNDKTSPLYYESKFYELLYANNDIENAEILLEEHKDVIPDYNLHKSTLLTRKKAPYCESVKYMKLYLKDNPEQKCAKYELLRLLYGEIFETTRIQYLIGVKKNDDIVISPVFNKDIDNAKIENLIQKISDVLNNDSDIPEEYSLSLKVMLAVLYAQKDSLAEAEFYKADIIDNYKNLTNDFDRNNLCLLLLIYKEYEKAYEIYKEYLAKDSQDISLDVTLNFVMKNFNVCIDLIDEYNLNNYDLVYIHSRYKTKSWEENCLYYKNNYDKYNVNIQLFILDYFCFNEEYDFCLEKYTELANKILNNEIEVPEEIISVITYNLDKLRQKPLADRLIAFYWNKNPDATVNFTIGMNYARQLYNKGIYSECLKVLKLLSEFDSNNPGIQELYMLIDIANGAYNSVISKYENEGVGNHLIPHVAIAYIRKKNFVKAEKALEQIKDDENFLEKYYIIRNIIYFNTSEYDKLVNNIEEAKRLFPDNIEIDNQIVGIGLNIPKDAKIPNEFGMLHSKALKSLTDNNLVTQIHVSENNLDELKQFMQKQNSAIDRKVRRENFNKIYKGYNDFQYPIELLYQVIDRNRIEVFSGLLLSEREKVNINLCDANLTNVEIENLENCEKVLIGIESLIILNELNLDLKTKGALNLHISNYTKLELEKFLVEENSKAERKGVLGSDESGNLRYTEYADEYKKYLTFLTQVYETYPTLESNSASQKGLNLIKESENFQTKDLFQDAIIAEQNDNTVVCIDGIMGGVFNGHGVKIASTMSIIEYLYRNKLISYNQYYEAKIKLIKLNCHYISITAQDLEFAIENKDYDEFLLLMRIFECKKFTIDSLALVFADFIIRISRNEQISISKKMNSIRDVVETAYYLYPAQSLMLEIIPKLLPDYLDFKNEIQYLFNKSMLDVCGEIYISAFIKAILVYLVKPEVLDILSENKDFYVDKIILNLPSGIRDKIKNKLDKSN